MFGDYRIGYMKALVNIKDILQKYDYKYLMGWSRGCDPKQCRLKSSFSKVGLFKILEAMLGGADVLITWGDAAEFKLAANTGKLTFISKPEYCSVTNEYRSGYADAIRDIIQYYHEHSGERIFSQKQVVARIGEMIKDRSYGGKLF